MCAGGGKIVFCQELPNVDHQIMQNNHIMAFITSIIDFRQNEYPNNRKYLYVWSPQGVKYLYFDPKKLNISVFLITPQFEQFGKTKQPQNTF